MNYQFGRVFMFANYTPKDKSIGITKKICSEINTLRSFGNEVYYTAYDNNKVVVYDNKDCIIFEKKYPFKNEKINHFIRYYCLEQTATEYLKRDNKFDIGYIRLGPPNSKLFSILKLLKNGGAKIVVESLAYFPGIKYHDLQGKYIQLMHALNHDKFKNYVNYFLVEGNIESMYDVPCYSMNMGVEVDSIRPHVYKGNPNELNLISVANETTYHAYDRVIKSVYNYLCNGGKRKVRVHLVGTISEETTRLIEQLQLRDYILTYGKKSGDELDFIYDKCNIGLGPFGQHRVGGKKDTGLKTKEYFAKGLPYIFSGEEPTVPIDYPYIFRFPSDESYIDFDKVWDFYSKLSANEQVIHDMRQFAKDNYSWNTIMKKALQYIQ